MCELTMLHHVTFPALAITIDLVVAARQVTAIAPRALPTCIGSTCDCDDDTRARKVFSFLILTFGQSSLAGVVLFAPHNFAY